MVSAREEHWIILFESIHHVLAAEEVFKQRGVWCDLVPVPRNLSSNCGMVIEFRESDLDAVRLLLTDLRPPPRGVYRPSANGHEDVTDLLH